MKKQRFKLFLLAIGWLLVFLGASAFRPSYLVEATMNHLNVEFVSKKAYVITVVGLRWVYRAYLLGLATFTIGILSGWR